MNVKFLNVVNRTHPMLENSNNNLNIDSDIIEVLNFLREMNKKPFADYIEFFNHHKEQTSCFIQNMSRLTSKRDVTLDSELFGNLKDQYDIFLRTKNMISEFKEIYDILIPSIGTELVSQSKELNKLIAFSAIDFDQKNLYKNEHNIDSLLDLTKRGGNFLFFNRVGRNSTISEKRLSSLSTDSTSSMKDRRTSMPLFLSERDMLIFDDFLEIEKLNDALFKALRELLSEKIDLFNNKYNADSKIFEDMIIMIKTKYLELDSMFEQLSTNLKKFETKITVEKWYTVLTEMFDNCMGYIEFEFNKVDIVKDSELPDKVSIINKHITLFNNLLETSWNDHLYDKVKTFRNALQIAWFKAKAKHNVSEKLNSLSTESLEKKSVKDEEKLKAPFVVSNDAKASKPKEKLSRAEKRKSVGTALFQRMNLRASFIREFDGLDVQEDSVPTEAVPEHFEISEVEELSFDTPENIIKEKDIDIASTFAQPIQQLEFQLQNISIDSFNEFGDSTLHDISVLTPTSNKLVVKPETVLKFSEKKTKIPIRDLNLIQDGASIDLELSHIQLKALEESLDKKRAGIICDLVKTYCNDNIKVRNAFVNCKPLNM